MLGVLLAMEILAFGSYVAWVLGYFDNSPRLLATKPEMLRANWLILLGVVSAVTGWIVFSWITIRNLVKQHTITTLLQTRLSSTYMETARHLNVLIRAGAPQTTAGNPPSVPYSATNPMPLAVVHDPKNSPHVDYILNFCEFIAVGIKHGDLHEGVLRDALRGIIVNVTKILALHIDELREMRPDGSFQAPRAMINLLWLKDRWDN